MPFRKQAFGFQRHAIANHPPTRQQHIPQSLQQILICAAAYKNRIRCCKPNQHFRRRAFNDCDLTKKPERIHVGANICHPVSPRLNRNRAAPAATPFH